MASGSGYARDPSLEIRPGQAVGGPDLPVSSWSGQQTSAHLRRAHTGASAAEWGPSGPAPSTSGYTVAPSPMGASRAPPWRAAPGMPTLAGDGTDPDADSKRPARHDVFLYNWQIAAALVPAIAVVIGYGSYLVFAVLLVGVMVAYILDVLGSSLAAFGVAWASLLLANLALLFGGLLGAQDAPLPLALALSASCGAVLLCAACWASVQFPFAIERHRAAVSAVEKFLMGACGPICTSMCAWVLLDALGPDVAPFYLAAAAIAMHEVLGQPRTSSFIPLPPKMRPDQRLPPQYYACSPASSATSAAVAALLPATVYLAVHLATLPSWDHLWSVLLLTGGALTYLFARPHGTWWLFLAPEGAARMRFAGLVVSSAPLTAGLVGRVFVPSFGAYLRAPWPLNVVHVAAVAVAAWAAVLAALSGADIRAILLSTRGMAVAVAAAVAAAASLGVPLYLLPLPAVAAVALCMYAEDLSPLPWLGFMGASGATMLWFVEHHFGFLRVHLNGVSVKALCWLLVALADLSMAAVGMLISRANPHALGTAMAAQALALTWLEETLFAARHEHLTAGIYPAWMVLLTSAAGLAATVRLSAHARLPTWSASLLLCTYAAKLVMVIPTDDPIAVTPALALALAVTPPLLLYTRGPLARLSALPPWAGWAHAAAVIAAVAHARFLIYDLAALALGSHPSEGLVLGALVGTAAAGLLPLVRRFYLHRPAARRAVALLAALAALLALLRPPLSVVGGAMCPRLPFALCPRLWDERHFPSHESDDAAIYGAADRAVQWPLWLLVAAVALALAALPAALGRDPRKDARRASAARAVPTLASAALAAAYVALQAAPGSPLLQAGLFVGAMSAAATLVLLSVPVPGASAALPWLYVAWAASLPANLALHAMLPVSAGGVEAERLYGQLRTTVEEERYEERRVAILGAYAVEALLVAFTMNLRVTSAMGAPWAATGGVGGIGRAVQAGLAGAGAGAMARAAGFLGMRGVGQSAPVERMEGMASAQVALSRHQAEGLAWLATAANAAALLCFGVGVLLARYFSGGSDLAVPILAPVLLLLSQDGLLLADLTQRRRYAPPAMAVSGYLAVAGAAQMAGRVLAGEAPMSSTPGLPLLAPVTVRGRILTLLQETLALACTHPTHALFCNYLWTFQWIPWTWLLFTIPLNIVTVMLSAIHPLTVMGILGLCYGAAQIALQWHNKRRGQRMV